MGTVHRSLPARLRHAWRAGERGPWTDLALAAVLSLAATWLTIGELDLSPGGGDSRGVGDGFFPPPTPGAPAAPPAVPQPGWSVADLVPNLMMTVPLAGRRRWPLGCVAVQFAGLLPADVTLNLATLAALVIGAYSLAVYGRSAPLSMATLLVAAAATAAAKDNSWPPLPDWSGGFAILLPIGLFGVAIRAARSRARASREQAEALERGQRAATRLAVAQERARIARELHDVVSHHVSVMTIQAGAAGKILDADPELARGALAAIESSGRETMAELRHLLGVLNPGETEDLLRPQPGLAQLDALVGTVRRAGQPVSVRRAAVDLPRGMDLTAYRVVQEALTNALRHAPGACTEVAIAAEGTDLVIEVTNQAAPAGSRPAAGTGAGTGLLGLAERLRLYGGTLESGRRVGGGFRVRARLPIATAAPEAA
jgi:signal transduction histidine kinase